MMSEDPEETTPPPLLSIRFPYGKTCGGALEMLRQTATPLTIDDLHVDASAHLHMEECPGCQARYGGILRLN